MTCTTVAGGEDSDDQAGDSDGGDDDDDDDDNPDTPRLRQRRAAPTPKDCEEHLADYLISRVLTGKMDAKEACTIAYWCHHFGFGGAIASLSLRPDSPTGHFKRRFDAVIGASTYDQRTIYLDVPGHSSSSMGRVVHQASCFHIAK
jgi:hypothetical protein